MSEPSMPRQRNRAVNSKLVSQADEDSEVTPARGHADGSRFFFASPLRSARLLRTARDLGPQPSTLLLLRLSSSRP